MIRKVVTAGNSSAVTLPISFMESLNIKAGDMVYVKLNLEGKIEIKPIEKSGNK